MSLGALQAEWSVRPQKQSVAGSEAEAKSRAAKEMDPANYSRSTVAENETAAKLPVGGSFPSKNPAPSQEAARSASSSSHVSLCTPKICVSEQLFVSVIFQKSLGKREKPRARNAINTESYLLRAYSLGRAEHRYHHKCNNMDLSTGVIKV